LTDGRRIEARAVVIASGAAHRRPDIAELSRFEGRGVSYWASPIEGRLVKGCDVALVGGGNSAGQGLAATMSQYLVDRINANARIELHPHAQVLRLQGDQAGLTRVVWRTGKNGEEVELATRSLSVRRC